MKLAKYKESDLNIEILIKNQVLRKIIIVVESDVKNWAYISLTVIKY